MLNKFKKETLVLIVVSFFTVCFFSYLFIDYKYNIGSSSEIEVKEITPVLKEEARVVDPKAEKEAQALEKLVPNKINKGLVKDSYLTGMTQYPKLTWNTIVISHEEPRAGLRIDYPKFNGGLVVSGLNKYINDKVDSMIETSKKDAVDLIRNAPDDIGSSLQLSLDYKVVGVTNGVVSIELTSTDLTGGGNGDHSYPGTINWDLKTNRLLKNEELFCDINYIEKLIPVVRKNILKDFSSSENLIQPLPKGIIDWVNSGTENNKENWDNLLITKDGLIVVFPPYQVSSGASGIVQTLISFKDIPGVVCLP